MDYLDGTKLECTNYKPWDMLIAFPPCTYLCHSGIRWLYGGKGTTRDPVRWKQMRLATVFFRKLLNAPIRKKCLENPTMHRFARNLIGVNPSQSIQPWQYGCGEIKRTCLWLQNLPKLRPMSWNIVSGRHPRAHLAGPSPRRGLERSRTPRGLAMEMARQWG